MITTKADKLLRSLIEAGLYLTDFTILATKVMHIQRDFKTDNQDRRERDRLRQQTKIREQLQFEQQLKDEEERRKKGLAKLKELGYVTGDETNPIDHSFAPEKLMQTDQLLSSYSKELNYLKQKQRGCCLTFNIDYDLRLNQQALGKACRRAKRNIYELRADRFNRPEHRSVLSVETATLHNKLKETVREINKLFLDSKSEQDKKTFQELLTYINQFEGDIDLLMCQMQYEPKVKETILFSSVTTDILDRMNVILHYVHTLAKQISSSNCNEQTDANLQEGLNDNLSNIPTKVAYIIKIKTNDDPGTSLSNDSTVSVRLYGTSLKSPDIRLIQSINKIKWQAGQIDLFNIELSYLGDLYAMEIWHDSQYSSWKVDWIEVIDDAANIFRFPLERSLDKHSNEKKSRFIVQRDIGPVSRLPTKPLKQIKPYKQLGFSTYTVQIKTGKQPNRATDSSIYIQLKGENGAFSDNLCSANSAFKNSVFEPDQLDTFYLIWPHLAKLSSLHLLVQSEGVQPSWFCEYVTVDDSQTGDHYKFLVNQLFDGSNRDDPNVKRHLTVYPENTGSNQKDSKEENEKPSYLVKLKTGGKGLSNMSTIPAINIILKGEKGKSEPYTLKSGDNKRKVYQANQTDEFLIPSKYYVGPVTRLQLSTDDQIDKWFIETIIVRDIAKGQDYIFPLYKWMTAPDGKNGFAAQPINEEKPDYKIYIRTLSSELSGPDRSIKLLLQGAKGKDELELNHPITMFNTFQPGHKDEYYVENVKSLGDLQAIEVDITHPNIKKLGLDYIEIKDVVTNKSYRFNIHRTLDSKNVKMTANVEPISQSMLTSTPSKTSRSQLLLNRKNFDQLTTSVPQGAGRAMNTDTSETKLKEDGNQDIRSLKASQTEMSTTEINAKKSSRNDVEKKPYQIKIKTINKEFLDKDAKLRFELIDENDQSEIIIVDPTDSLQKGKTATFPLDSVQNLGKLANLKLSITGKKNNLFQPEFIEISTPKNNQIYRAEYTKDDVLNSDRHHSELIKPLKPLPHVHSRENVQPQGTAPSVANSQSIIPLSKKLTESLSLNDNDDDHEEEGDPSPLNNTLASSISQSLSKEMNSTSEKLTNSSTRQIRPGDRVKNAKGKPSTDYTSKSSLHEADWYRRSIETKPDHVKQVQLTTDQRTSRTNFDQRQATVVQNKAAEKNTGLLPNQISPRSLKQSTPSETNQASRTTREKNQSIEDNRLSSAQQSTINQKLSTDSARTTPGNGSPSPSSVSQLIKSTKTSTTSHEYSRTSTRSPQSSHLLSGNDGVAIPSNVVHTSSVSSRSRFDDNDMFSSNNLKTIPTNQSLSKSVSPSSRTAAIDTPTKRSVSASSSKPSTVSKDQSQQLIAFHSASPSVTQSHLSQRTISNKTSTDVSTVSNRENASKQAQVADRTLIDPNFNETNTQQNPSGVSAVTIQTIGTKSDSDSNIVGQSSDSPGSESALQNKSLLSPESTKKSRKSRRHDVSPSISQSLSTTPDSSTATNLNEHVSVPDTRHLSKETSGIQYASKKSLSDRTPLGITLKTSDTTGEKEQLSGEIISKVSTKDTLNIQSASQSTTSQERQPLSNTSTLPSPSSISKTSSHLPTKLTEIDYMSTVYEESEPSVISLSNAVSNEHQRASETNTTPSSIGHTSSSSSSQPMNYKIKSSSREKTISKKTIDAKTKLTPMKSTSCIEYEFRVQIGNGSELDGTNEHIFLELSDRNGSAVKIPLNNSMNNSKPFQKGQLDIFRLHLPNHFHLGEKLNLYLPQTAKDPLHIRYCELQERRTMNTWHFPIDLWLGENNLYNVEMYINDNNNSLL